MRERVVRGVSMGIAIAVAACHGSSPSQQPLDGGSDATARDAICALDDTYSFLVFHGPDPRQEEGMLTPPRTFTYTAHASANPAAGDPSCSPPLPDCDTDGGLD